MIAANELRIGNFVTDEFYDSFKTIIEVESINKEGVNLEIQDDGNYPECASTWIKPLYLFDVLHGIPITPEILKKCGLWLHNDSIYIYKHWARIRITKNFELILDDNKWGKIKYLHQLQNLYFALTQTELPFKP